VGVCDGCRNGIQIQLSWRLVINIPRLVTSMIVIRFSFFLELHSRLRKTTDGTRSKGAGLVSGVESDLSKERLAAVYRHRRMGVCAPAHKAATVEDRNERITSIPARLNKKPADFAFDICVLTHRPAPSAWFRLAQIRQIPPTLRRQQCYPTPDCELSA
jgi:hypothetical protein